MAKLQSYYVLCPLIDQKSFLGISDDKEEETVIVTLGRNVVNKYRLSDQKQTGGWTSKDHITAPVIYDAVNNCYVGVFNNNTIKMWNDDSDNLDKVKKYKFLLPILKVLPQLVIFANGNCASLTYALENRKSYDGKAAIKDSEEIVAVQVLYGKISNICYVVKSSGSYEIIVCPLRVELGDLEKPKLTRVRVARADVYVVGHYIHVADKKVYFLWSDSKINSYSVREKSWSNVGTIPWVSTSDRVSLSWMGSNHIVAFGSNLEKDGAIIVAYNVILGIGSCKYPMKMYTADAQLYCLHDRIILEASNHIGILPYVIEQKRHLSSLLGSHEILEDDCMEVADWYEQKEPEKLVKQGISERTVCAQVISSAIENSNISSEAIVNKLSSFKDVPESVIVFLINHIMKKVNTGDSTVQEKVETALSEYNAELKLLDHLFNITCSDSVLVIHLRSAVSLDSALFLISYIAYLLKTGSEVEEHKLLDWCTVLMDAFYQQYVMTVDEKVTEVLQQIQDVVKELINDMWLVDRTIASLHKFLYSKPGDEPVEELSYSIELMAI